LRWKRAHDEIKAVVRTAAVVLFVLYVQDDRVMLEFSINFTGHAGKTISAFPLEISYGGRVRHISLLLLLFDAIQCLFGERKAYRRRAAAFEQHGGAVTFTLIGAVGDSESGSSKRRETENENNRRQFSNPSPSISSARP